MPINHTDRNEAILEVVVLEARLFTLPMIAGRWQPGQLAPDWEAVGPTTRPNTLV